MTNKYKCTERYTTGWTDSRGVFGVEVSKIPSKRYGAEHAEDPSISYAKSLAASMTATKDALMASILKKQAKRYEGFSLKVDAHKYETEAKDLPIETCVNMWIIKYGDEPVDASELVEQDDLIWEIGNRLYWAGLLEHDQEMDTYACKS